jgi:hypothetical protein
MPFNFFLFIFSVAYQVIQQNKLKRKLAEEAEKRKGTTFVTSGEATNLPLVYGKAKIGGARTYHSIKSNYINANHATAVNTRSPLAGYNYGATDKWISNKVGTTYSLQITWGGTLVYSSSSTNYDEGTALIDTNRVEIGGYVYERGDQRTNTDTDLTYGEFGLARTPVSIASNLFINNLNSNVSNTTNEFLFVQQAICFDGISKVYNIDVNGKPYNDNDHLFGQRIHVYLDGGVADPMMTANDPATATNYFTNTAYASMAFRLNRDEQNYQGVPEVLFYVDGKKIKTITSSTTLSASTSFSENPAEILLDYLCNPIYGRGLSISQIDLPSFYNAKLICDTQVMPSAKFGGKVHGGVVVNKPVKRYVASLVLDTSKNIRENINTILETMGEAALVWSAGKYKLQLAYPTSLAAENALVNAAHVFTDDDIIRNEVNISFPNSQDKLNQVTVRFQNEIQDFKEDSVTWPKTLDTVYTTYLSEDNGQPLSSEISLTAITNPYHALAKAEQMVRFSRSVFTVEMTLNRRALTLEPGDYIKINSINNIGINNRVFKVEEVEAQDNLEVKIKAYYFTYTSLAWNVDDDIAYINRPVVKTTLMAPYNVSFTPNTTNILGISSGTVTWNINPNTTVRDYVVYASNDGGTTKTVLGTTIRTSFDVIGLNSGVYYFYVQSRDALGKVSNIVSTPTSYSIQRTTADRVAVIYADSANAATNNQSYSQLAGYNYVAYYVYSTGVLPTLPIRTGISFTSFVGPTGPSGSTGSRGPGWWRADIGSNNAVGLTTGAVNTYFNTYVGITPTKDDVFILATTHINGSAAYIYSGTAWVAQADFIDGDLLVDGTITGQKIKANTILAKNLAVGSFQRVVEEDFSTLNNWDFNFPADSANASIVTSTTTILGGTALRAGNNAAPDRVMLRYNKPLVFDPNITYKITIRVQAVAGTCAIKAGWVGLAADGVTPVDPAGAANFSQHNHCHISGNIGSIGTWQTFVGYTKGWGAASGTNAPAPDIASPGVMHPSVRYIVPAVNLITNNSTSGQMEVDYVIVERVIDGSLIEDGSIVANKISAGAIESQHLTTSTAVITDTAQIANGLITNAQIVDATIQGAKISNLTVDTIKVANNAISSINSAINGAGTGSDSNWVVAQTLVVNKGRTDPMLIFAKGTLSGYTKGNIDRGTVGVTFQLRIKIGLTVIKVSAIRIEAARNNFYITDDLEAWAVDESGTTGNRTITVEVNGTSSDGTFSYSDVDIFVFNMLK